MVLNAFARAVCRAVTAPPARGSTCTTGGVTKLNCKPNALAGLIGASTPAGRVLASGRRKTRAISGALPVKFTATGTTAGSGSPRLPTPAGNWIEPTIWLRVTGVGLAGCGSWIEPVIWLRVTGAGLAGCGRVTVPDKLFSAIVRVGFTPAMVPG